MGAVRGGVGGFAGGAVGGAYVPARFVAATGRDVSWRQLGWQDVGEHAPVMERDGELSHEFDDGTYDAGRRNARADVPAPPRCGTDAVVRRERFGAAQEVDAAGRPGVDETSRLIKAPPASSGRAVETS